MNLAKRIMIQAAGAALVLTGVVLVAAGPANANDRSVSVLCTDKTSGAWRVSATFSSIEVKADRPVTVTLGSKSVTLTQVGPNGTVTLSQNFPGSQKSADLIWSVVRLDYQNTGKLHLDQPAGCRATTTTSTPPTSTATVPPATVPPATVPPATAPPATAPPVKSLESPPPQVKSSHARPSLPVTGGPSVPLLALGGMSVVTGLARVRTSRRRPQQA